MEPLKHLIEQRLKAHSLSTVAQAAEICFYVTRLLAKYFDEAIAQTMEVHSLKGDTLWIGVSHPGGAELLRTREIELLGDLAKRFPHNRIVRLRTRYSTPRQTHDQNPERTQ